jgi:sugar lactone lactonase YvrE
MADSEIRTLLTACGLVESPRWHGDRLYFSDWSAGEVIAVDLAGRSEVVAHVKSLPLCTAWLPDGQRPGSRHRRRRARRGLAVTR